ncbi:hypothetical protein [Phyllobacterium chamaecytisi]|uniref:hypothetical protein n=1 Tax=Phyllobacterium chamaecytisi TaxID=2876082 RepID=UPI001CC96F32|nr:hypothetical protein [Phyllobacterium sp. KW56]MBZ9600369.1 hypothetical protein [Phyllobacterium sp. KW56]
MKTSLYSALGLAIALAVSAPVLATSASAAEPIHHRHHRVYHHHHHVVHHPKHHAWHKHHGKPVYKHA